MIIDTTSNRIKCPYIPADEGRDDLEVLTTELANGANQEVVQDARRATTSNRILHRQKSELGEAAAAAAGLPSTPKRLRPVDRPNNQHEDQRQSQDKRRRMRGKSKARNQKQPGTRTPTRGTEQLRPVVDAGGEGRGHLRHAEGKSETGFQHLYSKTM